MKTLILTGNKGTELSRRTAKILNKLIPNSQKINKGNRSVDEIYSYCFDEKIDLVVRVSSKYNQKVTLEFIPLNESRLRLPINVTLTKIIDHQIYGWESFPANGPVSLPDVLIEDLDNELQLFLRKVLQVTSDKSKRLWLFIDTIDTTIKLKIMESRSKKTVFTCNIKVKKHV